MRIFRILFQNRIFRVSLALSLAAIPLLVAAGSTILRLVGRIEKQVVRIEDRQELAPRVEQLLRDLRETTEARSILQTIRPEQDSPVSFVTGLEGMAVRVGVPQTITALPKEAAPPGLAYVSPVIRYRVNLECALPSCEVYLKELLRMPQLVAVERLELTAVPGGDLGAGANATLHLALAVMAVLPKASP